MTALGGQDVKRTFSARGGFLTGLSRQKTHEADAEDFGDFVNVVRTFSCPDGGS
jgi:hypothetical protein